MQASRWLPWRPSEWNYRSLDMGQRLWFRWRPSLFLTASSTPSICVIVRFSCANNHRRVSSGDSRSPSHKRTSGIMLPLFLYSLLRLLSHLPPLLSSFVLNLPSLLLGPPPRFFRILPFLHPYQLWTFRRLTSSIAIAISTPCSSSLMGGGCSVFGANGASAAHVAV